MFDGANNQTKKNEIARNNPISEIDSKMIKILDNAVYKFKILNL